MACLDGDFELVNLFLENGLDPTIKIKDFSSKKVEETQNENCLIVSARWNYIEIVKLLLSKNLFCEKDIQICLTENISQNMRKLLMSYCKEVKVKNFNFCC